MSHLRHGRPHRIRGWGLVKAPNARLQQRRYMRLIHYNLTVFDGSDEDGDWLIFEQILVGSTVSTVPRSRTIHVKFPTDRFTVQLRTDTEFHAWSNAFVDAARVAADYYTVVRNRELGTGAFSTVYFGFDREDGHHVAIKVVEKTQCSRAELAYAETEARMMAFVRHPSIVTCRDIFDAPDTMHVVMEYMSEDTLENRMLQTPPAERRFDEPTAATIMAHVLSALAYLEKERVCHRDVKPDNILLSSPRNDDNWATTARLSDFGLAAFITSDTELTDIVGTPHYVAPEVISRAGPDNAWVGYGPPVDVWAAGVLMYWMLTGGQLPFDGEDSAAIFRATRAAQLDLSGAEWQDRSSDAKVLLCSLLHAEPRTRLRASGAVLHPWLALAHDDAVPALAAQRFAEHGARRAALSARQRLRAVVLAVVAVGALLDVVDGARRATARADRADRARQAAARRAATNGDARGSMQRAPERAPAGADGLGYNVGLIPSFAPKRRAKAGLAGSAASTAGAAIRRESSRAGLEDMATSTTKGSRSSRESGSSGSRAPSGERAVTNERKSIDSSRATSKSSSWGFLMRKRRSEDNESVS